MGLVGADLKLVLCYCKGSAMCARCDVLLRMLSSESFHEEIDTTILRMQHVHSQTQYLGIACISTLQTTGAALDDCYRARTY